MVKFFQNPCGIFDKNVYSYRGSNREFNNLTVLIIFLKNIDMRDLITIFIGNYFPINLPK